MKLNFIFLFWLCAAAIILERCAVSTPISGRNISETYVDKGSDHIGVEYLINHAENGATSVLWKVDPTTLDKRQSEGSEEVSFVFRYRIYTSYSEATPIDSGKVVVKDLRLLNNKPLQNVILLKLQPGRNYLLDITLRDLISSRYESTLLDVLNPGLLTNQSLKLIDINSGQNLFSNVIYNPDSFIVETGQLYPNLYLKYYHRDFLMASPPFATINPKPFDFNPDKVVCLERLDPRRYKVMISQSGLYQISDNAEGRQGATFLYFGESFPKPQSVNDLLYPLRFITTSSEFSAMAQGDNIKKNIDAHWLKIGGNEDRTRQLISSYYSRVETANDFFTSYLEGWKSDRGMCYIIFGVPSKVYRSSATETWIYGDEAKYNSLSLTFTKVSNPFAQNDFRLNRSGALRTPWYRAVDFWRQGRVINYR